MAERNPYLDLLEDDEPVKKPRAAQPVLAPKTPVATEAEAEKPAHEPEEKNVEVPRNSYDDLMDDEPLHHDIRMALPGAAAGAAAGYLSTGAGFNPTNPSASLVNRSGATSLAEMLTGAPSGSVAELNSILHPTQARMTPEMASKLAAEARVPSIAPVAPAPVEAVPKSGGAKWMENWANMEKPGFEGGVPEASQAYQRSKPQGKITSKLYKKFGNMPLNIEGQAAANAITQDEALSKVRQALYEKEMHSRAVKEAEAAAAKRSAQVAQEAQKTARASKLAGPLSVVGRTLAGAGLGLGAYDAYNRWHEGDKFGAGLSGAATLLGTAVPITAPLGAAAVGLYDAASNRIAHLKEHPEDQQVVDDRYDALGNPLR